eukprot:Rhum_TRINITY_DN14832_c0_g1::Rhum_TRINITY_DN14832_c0_g1_i1::g.124671::m.124671
MSGIPSVAVMQQQQCEVAASLRVQVDGPAAAERVAEAVSNIELFMRDVHDAAEEMDLGVDVVVQALLAKLQSAPTAFDQQAGTATVPMHQNKILDRSARVLTLDTQRVKDDKWILKQVSENLPKLLSTLATLREVVKIKVEDASDIAMARKWSAMAFSFFNSLKALSSSAGGLFQAWTVVDSGVLPLADSTMGEDRPCGAAAAADVALDYTTLASLSAPFQDRLLLLQSVAATEAGSEAERSNLVERMEELGPALCAQVKDNRSQVLKAACHAVRRVVPVEGFGAVSVAVTRELILRLGVANKTLAAEVASVVTSVATSSPTADLLQLLCDTCENSSIAAQQTKCAEALVSYLQSATPAELQRPVVRAAERCAGSRHAAARAAAKQLKEAARSLWGEEAVPTPPPAAAAVSAAAAPRRPSIGVVGVPKLAEAEVVTVAATAVAPPLPADGDNGGLPKPVAAASPPLQKAAERGLAFGAPATGAATPCGMPAPSLHRMKRQLAERRRAAAAAAAAAGGDAVEEDVFGGVGVFVPQKQQPPMLRLRRDFSARTAALPREEAVSP